MADILREIGALKERAMRARDRNEHDRALQILDQAERMIGDELAELERTRTASGPGEYELSMKKQLYHIRGSKGGVHRRKQDWKSATAAYDLGREVERHFDDSYNLTQRLVSRVLANPAAAEEEDVAVEGVKVREALREARRIIEQQMAASRENDEYAAADLLTVALLLGDDDWPAMMQRFLSRASPSSYAREVTGKVLEEISEHVDAARCPRLASRLAGALSELRRS